MERIVIKPEREYLREIVSKITSNTYAIPAFQRDFVWKKNQVLDLFDSIQRGYPIGSIILWKPKEMQHPAIKNIVSDKVIDVKPSEYYILDGRQRCTAFFGNVLNWANKDPRFCLLYDVEDDGFVYKAKKRSGAKTAYRVSDVYETFTMLGILQDIMQSNISEEKKRLYVTRIKEINTILQQYEIGEMIIQNCTLEESSTVFSRINSKGTDISKVEMLQAQTYKSKDSMLLASEIDNIIISLSDFGFSNMKPDDVLSCYAKYVDKNHYDNNLLTLISTSDISNIVPRLKKDVTAAVKFLHDNCGVISYKLLPYNKQLFAIASFFKENENPTEWQLKELKRWFFYSSYQQLFQNGSLSNIRPIFARFDEFVKGKKNTACEYESVVLDTSLDFSFKPSSAMSDFIILMNILERKSENPCAGLEYIGEYKIGGKKPENSFVLLSSDDRSNINEILKSQNDSVILDGYFLTKELVKTYVGGDLTSFFRNRKKQIVCKTKAFLEDLDLIIDSTTVSPTNNVNITHFLSEFENLNLEEKRELCEVLSIGATAQSAIYDIDNVNNDSFFINYSGFNKPYLFNKIMAKDCLEAIENKYCEGNDADSYFSWLISLEHDTD